MTWCILRPGRTVWRSSRAHSAGALIDARDYYRAFYRTAQRAEHYILIAGWQFDSSVPLLRGEDAKNSTHAVEFLPFLCALCEQKPNLRVYLLAWDYSFVFALEREWMQRVLFDWMTCDRIQFRFDDTHPPGGSHHQKLVVVDGHTAFVGGLDLCEGRWDDRRHAIENPFRLNRNGSPQKPYHDVTAYCCGPVVSDLEQLFCERWSRATLEPLDLGPSDRTPKADPPGALPIACRDVGLSRTFGPDPSGNGGIEEVRFLYEDAILAAERLIYLESQYFTSRVVVDALVERLSDAARPRLEIVLMLPQLSDTPKEAFAIGSAQDRALCQVREAAREHGHAFGAYHCANQRPDGSDQPIFIHSKVLIVDERLLSIGSANFTNRSMHMDSELNLVWECRGRRDEKLRHSIAALRSSLLEEHTDLGGDPELFRRRGLVTRLDEIARPGISRLRARSIPESPEHVASHPLRERTFDPDRPLDELALEEFGL